MMISPQEFENDLKNESLKNLTINRKKVTD